LWPNQ